MTKIDTSPFKKLIGVWKTTGVIFTGEETLQLNGIDSYEFILEGNFILHKADVMMGLERSETIEIISLDGDPESATMHYFNSKGESGFMKSEIENNDFFIHGKGIKFTGTFNDKATEINGKWFLQADDKSWKPFIELKLERQESAVAL